MNPPDQSPLWINYVYKIKDKDNSDIFIAMVIWDDDIKSVETDLAESTDLIGAVWSTSIYDQSLRERLQTYETTIVHESYTCAKGSTAMEALDNAVEALLKGRNS